MKTRKVLGTLVLLGTMVLPFVAPEAATQKGATHKRYSQAAIGRALRYVDELEVQGQRLMTEALQIALQIEPERSIEEFEKSRDYFIKVLRTLQTGDESIGLPPPQSPELIEPLVALQLIWDQLDPMFTKFLTTGQVTRTNIVLMSEFDNVLVDLAGQVEEAYEHTFAETNLASIATITVVQAEHLSFLIERMQTEMLLIAYEHDVEAERQRLADSMAIFERTLEGLISGNPGLRLIPPPTPEVKAQLRTVQRIWDDVVPYLGPLSKGGQMDRASVTHLVNRMEPLFEEMERTVALY